MMSVKMTDMQVLRNSLFDELSRLKRGTSTAEEANAVVKISNSIVSTYNTEIKAVETITNAHDKGYHNQELELFEDTDKEPSEIKRITKG